MKKIIVVFSVILVTLFGILNSEGENARSWEKLINVKVVDPSETGLRVVMETTGEAKFHVFKVTNPPRLVIEMVDVVHNWSKKEIEVKGNLIKRIRSGQYKDSPVKIVRVVLDMAVEDYYYEEVSTKNQITIPVRLTEKAVEKLKKKKKAVKKIRRKKQLELKPNIPTEEHKEKIVKILEDKGKRDRERSQRLKRIPEVRKKITVEGEEVPFTISLSKEPVDFNFKDADIVEVLRGFAMKLGLNIVPSPNVKGSITLRLKGVPFDEAFNMLMDRMDLIAIQKTSNVIEVMQKDEMPTQRETFYLASRTAGEISATLEGLLTKDEIKNTTIAIDDASNSLIVSATSEMLSKIGVLVRQLDIRTPQVKIKVRLIEVTASEDSSYGVTWLSQIDFTDPDGIQQIRGFKDFSNFSFNPDGSINKVKVFGEGGVFDISAVIDNTTLYGVLNFLASDSNAKTISEPTILTENNKNAKIHVGQNLPVTTFQVSETGTTQTVEYIPEGIDLCVTPVVSPGSNLISLKINVNVSEFVSFVSGNPVTKERAAQTEVTIESGKTVIIGGLITESVTAANKGIPLLKDLPIIGFLFKNKTNIKERTELLVFLSPEILID